MRKKIKELMNREEGFTLVELLAVIVILGIIVAIAIPAIGNVIDNARTNSTASENSLVEDAARLYVVSEDITVVDGTPLLVTVNDLKAAGYLEDRGEVQDLTGTVTITKTSSTTTTLNGTDTTTGADGYEYVFARN